MLTSKKNSSWNEWGSGIKCIAWTRRETGSTVSTPININSDDFRYSEKNVYFSAGNNIPIFNGEEVDSKDFRFKIVEGFEDFSILS